ncbi:hypothetical protein KAU32_06500 [bacterium]|nr:hypothetical protein [bacterium]
MKRKTVIFVLTLALLLTGFAGHASTFFYDELVGENGLDIFLGPKILTDPDNPSEKEYWFFSSISPELNLGMISLGLDLQFQYNLSDGEFYSEDWDTVEGIIRKIRFIKFGGRGTKYFFRFGELKGAFLTPGVLMSGYDNTAVLDQEKRGIEGALDFGMAGVELMINDITAPYVIGARVFYRPLKKTKLLFLSGAELGLSYAGDIKAPANVATGLIWSDELGDTVTAVLEDESGDPITDYKAFSSYAVDVNVPLTKFGVLTTGVYGAAGFQDKAGSGLFVGAYAKTIFNIQISMEYRNITPDFMINYFDETYDVDRWNYAGTLVSKYDALQGLAALTKDGTLEGRRSGIFGEIAGNLMDKILISGSYEDLEGPANGVLRIKLDATRFIDKVKATLVYTQMAVDHPKDIFTIDDRSFIVAKIDYAINKFLLLSMDYKRIYQYNEITGTYDPVSSLTPTLLFSIDF